MRILQASGLPYVIENVQDASKSLIDPVRICGTGLGIVGGLSVTTQEPRK